MKQIRYIFLFLLIFPLNTEASKKEIFFNMKFGFIKGGETKMVITDTVFNNIPAIHYYLEAKTTGVTDKLYGIYDVYETTVDAKTHLPLKSIRNIKEGKYRWYNETLYYHDVDSIHSQKTGWRSVPSNLVDIVSMFFYFIHYHLHEDIVPGVSVTLPTFHADKIDTISVVYFGNEKVSTGLGKIDTYALVPFIDKGKVLKRSGGLKFFISRKSMLPVAIEFEMLLGALRAELVSYYIDGVKQDAD